MSALEDEIAYDGLSPRLRGNRLLCPWPWPCRGSIPAPAGEPPKVPKRRALKWVYPRACGGTDEEAWLDEYRAGLSPRLRGNRRSG